MFSPAEAESQRRKEMAVYRQTPIYWGNAPGTNVKRIPKRRPGAHYTTTSYGRAIAKAIKKAYRPEGMSDKEFKNWKPKEHWHPHQLRHNYATQIRREHGLEMAQILLGHSSIRSTQIYTHLTEPMRAEIHQRVNSLFEDLL